MKKLTAILLLLSIVSVLPVGCSTHPASSETFDTALPTETVIDTAAPSAAETASPAVTEAAAAVPKDDKFYVVDIDATRSVCLSYTLCETDDAFYYKTADGLVLFTGKEYKDWMPLCGKPNCMHSAFDEGCNARLECKSSAIWLYGNHLYYASAGSTMFDPSTVSMQLWRMKLDGTDHEQLKVPKLTLEGDAEYDGFSSMISFHNKYLILDHVRVCESEGRVERTCYLLDLDDPGAGLEELEFKLDGGDETVGVMCMRYGEGDIIYSTDTLEGNNVYRLDLSARTATTLGVLPFDDKSIRLCSLYEGKLYFADGFYEGKIVAIDAKTGEMEIMCSAEPKTELWYYPCGAYVLGAEPNYAGSSVPCGTVIYSNTGEVLQRIEFEDYNENIGICCISGYYVFGVISTNDPSQTKIIEYLDTHGPNWYLDLRDIGTGNLAWRKWEPEG